MTIFKMDNFTVLELEKVLSDKIKSLRELEAKIENMYEIGAYDNADHLEMISDVVIEDIIKIEDVIEKKGENKNG